jgi:hypothetical protein
MSFYSIFPKITNQPQNPKENQNEPAFELVDEQALNKSYTSSGTSTEQAVVPSINYINNTNIANKKTLQTGRQEKKINNADFKKMKLKMKCPLHSPTPIKIKLESSRQKKKSCAKKRNPFWIHQQQ